MTIDLESLQRLAYAWLPVLLDAAVKGVVLLAVAGLLALAMRKASAAARQMVWLGALAALLALPLASAALPGWQVLQSGHPYRARKQNHLYIPISNEWT